MRSLNVVHIIGHIGHDPEVVKHDGKSLAKFSVATGESWLDKTSNQKKTHTEWHKVVCFNRLAEIVQNHTKKGARVYLSGKLKTSKWNDKNGEYRYITEIVAEELIMLDTKSNGTLDE